MICVVQYKFKNYLTLRGFGLFLGLPYLLHKGVYLDAFTLHDESITDPFEEELKESQGIFEDKNNLSKKHSASQTSLTYSDARCDLNDTWTKFYKFQPLWKIRNYFGEKIAFYFAWSGLYISSLWLPMLLGLAIFIYGLYLRYGEYQWFNESFT